MSSCLDRRSAERGAWAVCAALLVSTVAAQAQTAAYPNLGRAATREELAAWDIDVRPDFKGLPKGAGSVRKGMEVWESKCASCHGVFGESNQVFTPIVGGTTAHDVRSGRVARLTDGSYPGRTTLMKLSNVSALWDHIRRAMPWNEPKSLGIEEVYGVTAYILNMGGIVPDEFTLSDRNIAEVQQRLPNRNGMTTDHGLWPGRAFGHGKPDVRAVACMNNCGPTPGVTSIAPDHARDSHGNLAQQSRAVGAQLGADTRRPADTAPGATPSAAASGDATAFSLTQRHGCVACHGMDGTVVGPGFNDIAKKYAGRADAAAYLAGKVKAGGSGVWGAIAMPPQTLAETDARAIGDWLAEGAKR